MNFLDHNHSFPRILIFISLYLAAYLPSAICSTQSLPSGPEGPGRFGAYYTTLKYSPEWDKPWRVGEHADVVVRFDNGGHKFIFWRGKSYIPCWVTDAGVWYTW